MKRPRRRRKRKGSKHLTISARNAEWEEARAKADRRGQSRARYVKMLLDRDVSGGEKTFTALAPEEQRELLEGVRELRALLLTEEAAAPARDEEAGREPPAPPAHDEQDEETVREPPAAPAQDAETAREPSAPHTREKAGQAESSDSAESCDPAEPDEPEPSQGQLPF